MDFFIALFWFLALAAVTSGQSDQSSASPGDTLAPKPVPDTPISYSDTHQCFIYFIL